MNESLTHYTCQASKGVKSPNSIFTKLPYHDPVWDVMIDAMHLFFVHPSGAFPKIIKMWIDSK